MQVGVYIFCYLWSKYTIVAAMNNKQIAVYGCSQLQLQICCIICAKEIKQSG